MIKVITDKEFIRSFIYDDEELFSRISDDYTKQFIPTREDYHADKDLFLGYFENDVCKAMMSVDRNSSIILNIHINIPEKYRGAESYKMGSALLKFVEKNCEKRYVKLNAEIPSCFKDVIKFAEKGGFEIFGTDKESFIKNGVLHDRVFLSKAIER